MLPNINIEGLSAVEIDNHASQIREDLIKRRIPVSEIEAANHLLTVLSRRKIVLHGGDPDKEAGYHGYAIGAKPFDDLFSVDDLKQRAATGDENAQKVLDRYNEKMAAES